MDGFRNCKGVRTVVCAVILLVAATAGRLWLVDNLGDQGWFAKYPVIAEGLMGGGAGQLDRFGDVSMGYLAMVASLQLAGLDVMAIRSLQVVLVSVAALVCAVVGWRLWGAGAGVIAGVAILTSRAALVNATELEPETLMLLLAAIGLAAVLVGQAPRSGLVAGAVFALAALTRPTVILPFGLVVVGALPWARDRRARLRLAAVVVSFIAVFGGVRLVTAWVRGGGDAPMNPGTVFYESWNPAASGYTGEAPAVVKDVEHALALPDGLHVAYRRVAGHAVDGPPDRGTSNAFWWRRGVAYMTTYPLAAARLCARKALLGLHSHDAWDLVSMQRKDEELRAMRLWVPFGLLAGCAAAACLAGSRRQEIVALGLWMAGGWAVMVIFYVTSRQRNVLLPAVALLCAFAFSEVVARWRSGERRGAAMAAAVVAVVAVLLSIGWSPQREDLHTWKLRFAQDRAVREEAAARSDRNRQREIEWRTRGATFLLPFAGDPPQGTVELVRQELASQPESARVFDLAMVLISLERWREAEGLLEQLEASGYRPWRGARWTSSLAYHRARCRLAQNDRGTAQALVRRAGRQAPGDARVLALSLVLDELADNGASAVRSRQILKKLYDPVTVDRALARAWRDVGRFDVERSHNEAVAKAMVAMTARGTESGGEL